jgi:hypothetical protein
LPFLALTQQILERLEKIQFKRDSSSYVSKMQKSAQVSSWCDIFFPVPSGDLALIDGRCLVKQWETIASQLVDTVLFEEL